MIIAVQGTKNFSDYETFMRAMGVALSQPNNDRSIEVWSAGPHNVNNFTAAFCNSAENYLKQKGYKVSFKKLPAKYIEDNISNISYLAFFSKKSEKVSPLVAKAELNNTEIGIFRI
jgi:putative hemolysin